MLFRIYFVFVLLQVAKAEGEAEADVSKDKSIEGRALQVAELLNRNRKLFRTSLQKIMVNF